LSGHHSRVDIRDACKAGGGDFSSTDGGYGCIKGNRNVHCNNQGQCQTWTDRKPLAHGPVRAVLTGGGSSGFQGANTGLLKSDGLRSNALAAQGLASGGSITAGSALNAGGSKLNTQGLNKR
jgi:hypothetical protein